MAYTSNVPQANQQIAATQAPINSNFTFLSNGIGQEHNFNAASSGSDMYHKQASMPNKADPVALPAGTNGMYYVNGGVPKFYNTSAQFIQLTTVPYFILTGTVALNAAYVTVATLPGNSVGQYYILPKNGGGITNTSSACGQFLADNVGLSPSQTFDPGIDVRGQNLNLQAKISSGAFGTYTYLIIYSTL